MHWILVAVDVFSRKLYARAMPTKEVANSSEAFNDIIEEANSTPIRLDSDQGVEFGKTFDNNTPELTHRRANVGDHNALGIVDSAIRIFKNLLFKHMTSQGDPKDSRGNPGTGYYSWAKNLKDLVENFNDQPREALLGSTPNQVNSDKKLHPAIATLNNQKRQKTQGKNLQKNAPYLVGDLVRIPAQTGPFKRGFKAQMTDKRYKVTQVFPNSVEVDVNGKPRRYLFSEVNQSGVPLSKDVFEVEEVFDRTRTIKRGKKSVKQYWVKFSDGDEMWVDSKDILSKV